jgi:hypothetical protein
MLNSVEVQVIVNYRVLAITNLPHFTMKNCGIDTVMIATFFLNCEGNEVF